MVLILTPFCPTTNRRGQSRLVWETTAIFDLEPASRAMFLFPPLRLRFPRFPVQAAAMNFRMGTGQRQVSPPGGFLPPRKESPWSFLPFDTSLPRICSSRGRMAVALPKSTNTLPPSILWTIRLCISPWRFLNSP